MQVSFKKILDTDNLASLEDVDLALIASQVQEGYTYDEQSREHYLQVLEEVAKLLKVDLDTKSYPFANASNVNMPLIQQACVTFAARAYPAMIKDDAIVKAKPMGDDSGKFYIDKMTGKRVPLVEPGAKQARANRVQEYMNWEIQFKMMNWEDDFDKLLHVLPAYGSVFKKVYYSEADAKKHSDLIFPQFLTVNMAATSLEDADRITQSFTLSMHEIVQRINQGVFIDFKDSLKEEEIAKPHKFLEQHTRLDLDGDGYPEPYIVVLHVESGKVVGIYKRFEEVFYKDEKEKEVSYITARQYYVHYSFLPDFEGGFYGIGFGHLALKLNKAINSLINQIIDTGHMSLMGGGFIGKGLRMRGGQMKIPLGSYHVVNSSGNELKNNIVPLNIPAPSGTTLSLYDMLTSFVKNLTGMKDVLEGQIRSDQSATATIAMIDQSLNEFKSVFKRIYRNLKKEFEYLYRLSARHPNFEEYKEVLDLPEINIEDDINLGTYDIYPVADMSELTSLQRQMKSEIVLQMAQAGMVAMKPAVESRLQAIGVPDYQRLLDFEPTDQDKQLQQSLADNQARELANKQIELQNDQAKIEIDASKAAATIIKDATSAIKDLAQAEGEERGRQLEQYINQLERLTDEQNINKQGRVQGMEVPSGDFGVPSNVTGNFGGV